MTNNEFLLRGSLEVKCKTLSTNAFEKFILSRFFFQGAFVCDRIETFFD